MTDNIDLTDNPTERYCKHLQLKIGPGDSQIDKGTYERYTNDLEWFDKHLWQRGLSATDIGPTDTEEIAIELGKKYNGTTAVNRWNTISRAFAYLKKRDEIDENPCDRWDLKKDFGIDAKAKKRQFVDDDSDESVYAPSSEEIDRMVAHASSDRYRTRNQLVIILLYHTACRVNELRHIKIDDLERDCREIDIRASIAKYGNSRPVRYGPSAVSLLEEWLDHGRRDRLTHHQSPYLFISQDSDKMSKSRIEDIVRQAAQNAGVNERLYEDAAGNNRWKITPHSLRHSCATDMINNGADIYRVSKYLGHSSVKVTEETYVHESSGLGAEEAHEYAPQ
jgi:integrase/recombinase XerD